MREKRENEKAGPWREQSNQSKGDILRCRCMRRRSEHARAAPRAVEPFHALRDPRHLELPGCRVRRSSDELDWSSLFLSEQDEAPLSAEVNANNDHLIVMHLRDPVRVRLEATKLTHCASIPRRLLYA